MMAIRCANTLSPDARILARNDVNTLISYSILPPKSRVIRTCKEVRSMEIFNNSIEHAGKREVFCRYYTNKYGKRIYPRNGKVFHFWVDIAADDENKNIYQTSMFDNADV